MEPDFLPPALHFRWRIGLNDGDEYMGDKMVSNDNGVFLFCENEGVAVRECHVLSPELEQLDRLFQLLVRYLEKKGLSRQNLNDVKLVCEEIFVNIVNYSTTTEGIMVLLGHRESTLYVQFVDDGIPFDPLLQPRDFIGGEEVDDIKIGGLGIMMIKAISEKIRYTRENDRNKLLVSIKC